NPAAVRSPVRDAARRKVTPPRARADGSAVRARARPVAPQRRKRAGQRGAVTARSAEIRRYSLLLCEGPSLALGHAPEYNPATLTQGKRTMNNTQPALSMGIRAIHS